MAKVAPGGYCAGGADQRATQHVRIVAGAKLAALIVLITATGCTRKQVQQVYLPARGRGKHSTVQSARNVVSVMNFSLTSAMPDANLEVDHHGITRVVGTEHPCDGLAVDLPAGHPRPSHNLDQFMDDWLLELALTHVATSGKSRYLGSVKDTGHF